MTLSKDSSKEEANEDDVVDDFERERSWKIITRGIWDRRQKLGKEKRVKLRRLNVNFKSITWILDNLYNLFNDIFLCSS